MFKSLKKGDTVKVVFSSRSEQDIVVIGEFKRRTFDSVLIKCNAVDYFNKYQEHGNKPKENIVDIVFYEDTGLCPHDSQIRIEIIN